MTVTIIGLGLIGGSIAKRLKKSQFATYIVGVDHNTAHQQEAIDLGLVDTVKPIDQALVGSKLVIIAIPVDAAVKLLPTILDNIEEDATMIDMGSTKESICAIANQHYKRKNFVATHPMAGTEYSGPSAAKSDLFDGKVAIICDRQHSANFALEVVDKLYDVLNMKAIDMDAKDHDLHIAYVSHLSHITSFVLGETVLEKEKEVEHILNMAGSGFASTVRLAKSSPEMWLPIFLENSANISDVLGTYIQNLTAFKEMLDTKDSEGLVKTMQNANSIKKILD